MTDNHDELWQTFASLDEAGNTSGALDFLVHSRLKDDPLGQRHIGWIHAARKEFDEAASWYLKAARQNNDDAVADCMECAVLMWRDGFRKESLALAESPPLSSHETFQRFLMSRYFDLGDPDKLLEWASRVAVFGKEVDVVYAARLHISRDNPMAAVPYLEAAARQGSPAAHQLLGEFYWRGIGVAQDELRANVHYREGAKRGYVLSQTRLLHSNRRIRGVWYLPIFAVGLLALMAKGLVLLHRNERDPRLLDLPQSIPRKFKDLPRD